MSKYFNPGSALAGLSTGLRSMTATAVTLDAARSTWARPLAVLAVGEMVGDKLPIAPPRTQPVALLGRVAFAALSGAMLAKRSERCAIAGAVVAGSAAIASAYAGMGMRGSLVKALHVPDAVVALAEDALAFSLARRANA